MADNGDNNPPTSGGANVLKNLTDSKLVSFAIGQQKKSRFQKAREEKEQKRLQDEKEAAKVYESFVASFEDEKDKTFVKAGVNSSGGKKLTEMEKLMMEMKVSIVQVSQTLFSCFLKTTFLLLSNRKRNQFRIS